MKKFIGRNKYWLVFVVPAFFLSLGFFGVPKPIADLATRHDSRLASLIFDEIIKIPTTRTEQVVIVDPENIQWHNKSEYLKKELEKIIQEARAENLIDPRVWYILPQIHLAVANFWIVDGYADSIGVSIIIASHELRSGATNETLETLVHEFSHLLTPGDHHGPVWQKTCDLLLSHELKFDKKCEKSY